MRRVVSIGECMVELSSAEPGLWRQGFAGDTLNSAWYLRARLGAEWQVGYVTGLGTDRFSDAMADFIAGAGIDTSAIFREASRGVGLYAISLEKGERSFTYWRDRSAARLLAQDPARLARALEGVELALFSGITLAILEGEGRANLLKALAEARRKGTRIAFDPNIRERLWPDAATIREAVTAAASASDILLPSFEDEEKWFGDADPEATRARYAALGASEIVVKNGGGAISLWQAGGPTEVMELPKVTPVDTTGAGDSFNGGYLAARLQGAGQIEAARLAHDLASRVVGHRGALLPMEAAG